MDGWPLISAGATIFAPVVARVQANDGEALRQLVLAGNGIARLANFTIRDDLKAGRLVPVLDEYNPGDREEFHAIHIGQGGPLPSRVRALLDFLAKQGKVT
jgi:DNA-binding transcriptional LysR family regulator